MYARITHSIRTTGDAQKSRPTVDSPNGATCLNLPFEKVSLYFALMRMHARIHENYAKMRTQDTILFFQSVGGLGFITRLQNVHLKDGKSFYSTESVLAHKMKPFFQIQNMARLACEMERRYMFAGWFN